MKDYREDAARNLKLIKTYCVEIGYKELDSAKVFSLAVWEKLLMKPKFKAYCVLLRIDYSGMDTSRRVEDYKLAEFFHESQVVPMTIEDIRKDKPKDPFRIEKDPRQLSTNCPRQKHQSY